MSSTSPEALILIVNVAFSLTLADPVLHQIPVLYKGSENSWGDADTGIDLDMHPAVGDNFSEYVVSPSVEVGASVKSRVRQKDCCCRHPRLDSGT